jgi:hypothetical protein
MNDGRTKANSKERSGSRSSNSSRSSWGIVPEDIKNVRRADLVVSRLKGVLYCCPLRSNQ